jgi:SAM-dependent methyltransferase
MSEYRTWSPHPVPVEAMQVLETGSGRGYGVLAVARLGVKCAAGVEIVGHDRRSIAETPLVQRELGSEDSALARRVDLFIGDMAATPFGDGQFDLIHSGAVLEHVRNLPGALREMARVLKPGGLMLHAFYPFFGFSGGHASCTLDCPWGHARLSRTDFRRYLERFRPNERAYADDRFEQHFPYPRVSLTDVEIALSRAGFSVLSWREHWHPSHIPSSALCRDVQAVHPSAALRDLTAEGIAFVAVKD